MSKYKKKFSGVLDVYKVCDLYGLKDPAIFHAVKKLLRNGSGPKTKKKDVEEAIICLERWLELHEDEETFDEMVDRHAEEYELSTKNLSGDREDTYNALFQLSTDDINEIMSDLSRWAGIVTPGIISKSSDAKKLAKFIHRISDKVLSELQMLITSRNTSHNPGLTDNTENVEDSEDVSSICLEMNNLIEKRFRQFSNAIRSQQSVTIPNPPLPHVEGQTLENITEWWEKLDKAQKEEATRLFEWHKNK